MKRKYLLNEFLMPFLIMLVMTGIGIALFMFMIGIGPDIAPVNQVEGELTKPTLGRLVYIIVGSVASIITSDFAKRYARSGRTLAALYTGFAAGMLIWQVIGEASWHFGYYQDESYINFFRLESPKALPFMLAALIFTVHVLRASTVNFGMQCTLFSFICNWFGHFVLIGTYPYVSKYFTETMWYSISGMVIGMILSIAAVFLAVTRCRNTRERLLCAMLLYIGIGIISFGFME